MKTRKTRTLLLIVLAIILAMSFAIGSIPMRGQVDAQAGPDKSNHTMGNANSLDVGLIFEVKNRKGEFSVTVNGKTVVDPPNANSITINITQIEE